MVLTMNLSFSCKILSLYNMNIVIHGQLIMAKLQDKTQISAVFMEGMSVQSREVSETVRSGLPGLGHIEIPVIFQLSCSDKQ